MPTAGSTVVRRQLGRLLRRLRDQASKTERDVETAKLVGRTKLWRIETGKTAVRIGDVRALCWFYGADAATTDALADMALGTMEQNWWEANDGTVPEWFGLYVGLESAATEISVYESELVPGLFQTADYARAVYEACQTEAGPDIIDRHVQFRMRRQQTVFGRTQLPSITAIINAGALARKVGGDEVMEQQWQRLREQARNRHLDLRVLPFEVGAHAVMAGSFAVFDFAEADDPPVVYVELQLGARYLEKASELREYRRIFNLALKQTVPIEEYVP